MEKKLKIELMEHLATFVTDNKKAVIEEVLSHRTRHITTVLEDIYQPHNASAVVRTCDCFGIQDLHVIENKNKYNINPHVVRGASKWVDIYQHNGINGDNSQQCIEDLKSKGYKILATTPRKDCQSIGDVAIDSKVALVFGTELTGIQDETMEMADELVTVPMYGFTESYNLSVCAAICLHELREKLVKSNVDWQLTMEEKVDLKLQWYQKIINKAEIVVEEFIKNPK